MSDPIVGIDLGTSNSVVAYAAETGAVSLLADEQNFKIHPSVVSFHPNGGIVVGASAKQRKVIDPKNTIYSVKRLIGRSYNSIEVQTAKTRVPYIIKEGPNQQPIVSTRGGEFAVPEVSAIVLDHMRNIAAAQLGQPVNRAVVTVPASFNDAQRSATATAGAIAGLTVVRVLNEPTAAALAYGNTRSLREVIAVFDFGGGTFDITILKLEDQVYEVLGTSGDTFLGGDDLDERLVDRMVEKFLLENRIDLRTNEVSMMRLRAVAEQTKIELSRRSRAVVRVDEIAYGPKGKALDLQIEISRDEFVRQCADIIDRTFPVCQEALNYASLTTDKIDDVILVGGTTKIPYVRDQVARFFSRAPRTDVNPEDAVAVGAALQATSLERILKRKSPSVTIKEDTLTTPQTRVADLDDTTTTPGAEYPVPQATDTDELELLPPDAERGRRVTAGYAGQRRPITNREPDRPAQRGEHHDTFEGRTPPPVAVPLGRMTKNNMQAVTVAPTAPAAPTAPTISVPPITVPGVEMPPPRGRVATPPAGVPAARPLPPALTPPAPPATTRPTGRSIATSPTGVPLAPRAPAPPPLGRTISTSPTGVPIQRPGPPSIPPTFTPATPAPAGSAAEGRRGVIDAARPPATQPRPVVQPPPLDPATAAWLDDEADTGSTVRSSNAPTLIAPPPARPVQPPTAPTLVVEPSPAGTARGFGAQPSPADTAPGLPPASTAKGFAPPLATPIAPVVIDVTPRSLGVGTVAGYCEELIRRNARVPTEIRKLFTTSRDGQEAVRIIVCQGESRRLDSNVVLGDLTLAGLPARPRGEVTIEVTFMLDASGILQVRARDAQTGREQRATLDLVGAMPQAEVAASRERMQQLRR